MKVAVIGATGKAGSRVVAELLRRGHFVTGIARHPEALPEALAAAANLVPRRGDARDAGALAALLAGHAAAITATRFVAIDPAVLVAAVKQAGVPRLIVVGGAGTLITPSGLQFVDSPDFPPAASRAEALAGRAFLDLLRAEPVLDWTFLSPAAWFAPGERTGKFRLGTDALLVGADGKSAISMEDYAIALVDELERPRHSRRRFAVGY